MPPKICNENGDNIGCKKTSFVLKFAHYYLSLNYSHKID